LRQQLQELQDAKQHGERLAEEEKQRLLQKIAHLEKTLQDEINTPKGCSPEQLARLGELEASLAAAKTELKHEQEAHVKAREAADRFLHDKDKYKKDAAASLKKQQELQMKLSKAETLVASLQSSEGASDVLDTMNSGQKCLCLKRLLTDESLFTTSEWLKAVTTSLELTPPNGCGHPFKRDIMSHLFKQMWRTEQDAEWGASAVALVTHLVSTEDAPVDIYDLLRECVRTEVSVARMDEQTAFVEFLAREWFAEFESARESTEKCAQEFVRSWAGSGDMTRTPSDESKIKLNRQMVEQGLDLLGHTQVLYRQKRPTIQTKETYYTDKRDLLYRQKRPTILTKETYYTDKRDLLY